MREFKALEGGGAGLALPLPPSPPTTPKFSPPASTPAAPPCAARSPPWPGEKSAEGGGKLAGLRRCTPEPGGAAVAPALEPGARGISSERAGRPAPTMLVVGGRRDAWPPISPGVGSPPMPVSPTRGPGSPDEFMEWCPALPPPLPPCTGSAP